MCLRIQRTLNWNFCTIQQGHQTGKINQRYLSWILEPYGIYLQIFHHYTFSHRKTNFFIVKFRLRFTSYKTYRGFNILFIFFNSTLCFYRISYSCLTRLWSDNKEYWMEFWFVFYTFCSWSFLLFLSIVLLFSVILFKWPFNFFLVSSNRNG